MFRSVFVACFVGSFAFACSSSTESSFADEESVATDESGDALKQVCGGFANIACPTGYKCVDDPSDSCDPKHGGADCGGLCVKAQKKFCPNPGGKKSYVLDGVSQCAAARIDCRPPYTYFADACGCGCKVP